MRITTKTQYGLRGMIFLAEKEGPVSLKEIWKEEGISLDYLEKIFEKLKRSGLVNSKKGMRGGYFLAKKPEKIKVGEIIKVLEGEPYFARCLNSFCPKEKKCKSKKVWKRLKNALNSALNSFTLFDLIKK